MKAEMFHFSGWLPYESEKQFAEFCEKALIESGFKILNKCEHYFPVQGYTGLWLLSESHFAIHSFPEENHTYIELTSCVEDPFLHMKGILQEKKGEILNNL